MNVRCFMASPFFVEATKKGSLDRHGAPSFFCPPGSRVAPVVARSSMPYGFVHASAHVGLAGNPDARRILRQVDGRPSGARDQEEVPIPFVVDVGNQIRRPPSVLDAAHIHAAPDDREVVARGVHEVAAVSGDPGGLRVGVRQGEDMPVRPVCATRIDDPRAVEPPVLPVDLEDDPRGPARGVIPGGRAVGEGVHEGRIAGGPGLDVLCDDAGADIPGTRPASREACEARRCDPAREAAHDGPQGTPPRRSHVHRPTSPGGSPRGKRTIPS